MRWTAGLMILVAGFASLSAPCAADDIGDKLDAAKAAYTKGDSLRSLEALQTVSSELSTKLTEQFVRTLPPAPQGWEATVPDSQPLDAIGGGITITRGYQKGEAALNASLIVDNPAVANTLALFKPDGTATGGDAGWKPVKVAGEDALLRYDPANHIGEIVIALQGRAALQIDGSDIASDQPLTDLAQGWNIALLKKLLGP